MKTNNVLKYIVISLIVAIVIIFGLKALLIHISSKEKASEEVTTTNNENTATSNKDKSEPEKTIIDEADFVAQMTVSGLTSYSIPEDKKEGTPIVSGQIAQGGTGEVDYYVCSTVDGAKIVYEATKQLAGSNLETENEQHYDSYEREELYDDEYYYVTARVDNTIIFGKVNIANKASLINVITELGY